MPRVAIMAAVLVVAALIVGCGGGEAGKGSNSGKDKPAPAEKKS